MERLAAFLPLSATGSWGGDEISRAENLILSIEKHWEGSPFNLTICHPRAHDLLIWTKLDKLKLKNIILHCYIDEVLTKVSCSGWRKQQLLKLESWRAVEAENILILDSDLLATSMIALGNLLPCGQPAQFHTSICRPDWWAASASILQRNKKQILSRDTFLHWTPQVLERVKLEGLCSYLEKLHGKEWHQKLSAIGGWSEFSLYGIFDFCLMPDRNYLKAGLNSFIEEASYKQENPLDIRKRYGL